MYIRFRSGRRYNHNNRCDTRTVRAEQPSNTVTPECFKNFWIMASLLMFQYQFWNCCATGECFFFFFCRQDQLWAQFRNGIGVVGVEKGCTPLSCNLWCDIWNAKNRLSAVHFVNLVHRHKFSLSWEGILERITSTVPSLNSSSLSQRSSDQWDVAHGLGIGKFAFGRRSTSVCVCYGYTL